MSDVSTSVFAHFYDETKIRTFQHDGGSFSFSVGDVTLCFENKSNAILVLRDLLFLAEATNGTKISWSDTIELEGK